MALFIALPFIGGYIGYNLAPEKVVETERIVEVHRESEINESLTSAHESNNLQSIFSGDSYLETHPDLFTARDSLQVGQQYGAFTIDTTDHTVELSGTTELTGYFVTTYDGPLPTYFIPSEVSYDALPLVKNLAATNFNVPYCVDIKNYDTTKLFLSSDGQNIQVAGFNEARISREVTVKITMLDLSRPGSCYTALAIEE